MIQQAAVGLEESPLNRQPLPHAETKIGAHYPHLLRKGEEPLRVFLLREDKVHDDMLRALQRLHGEQELVFDDSDTNLEKLKTFGIFSRMSLDDSLSRSRGRGHDAAEKEDADWNQDLALQGAIGRELVEIQGQGQGYGCGLPAEKICCEADGERPRAVECPGHHQGLDGFGGEHGNRKGGTVWDMLRPRLQARKPLLWEGCLLQRPGGAPRGLPPGQWWSAGSVGLLAGD